MANKIVVNRTIRIPVGKTAYNDGEEDFIFDPYDAIQTFDDDFAVFDNDYNRFGTIIVKYTMEFEESAEEGK